MVGILQLIGLKNQLKENNKMERELDYAYKIFVFEQIHNATASVKKRWIIYDSILDVLNDMREMDLIDEIKYRITDNENDVKVFKSSLKKIKNKNDTLNLLINSI
jgi:hypothetical protein|tara:strand:- start:881 stop:1195 length:315 start_codon:yes stop_codon:yes gene_type:complete